MCYIIFTCIYRWGKRRFRVHMNIMLTMGEGGRERENGGDRASL
jgi:hypothetical protein